MSAIDDGFLADVISCAALFKNNQEEAILRNLTLYNLATDARDVVKLKNRVADSFMGRYQLKRIDSKRQLVGARKLQVPRWKVDMALAHRSRLLMQPGMQDRLLEWKNDLEEMGVYTDQLPQRLEWRNQSPSCYTEYIDLIAGKPYETVRSSKFCNSLVLSIYKQVIELTGDARAIQQLAFARQADFLTTFLAALDSLPLASCYEYADGPLLSRFSVSSLWIIGQLFETVHGNKQRRRRQQQLCRRD